MVNFPIDKIRLQEAVNALTARLDEIGQVQLRFRNDVEGLEEAHRALGKGETGEHFRRGLDTLPPNRMFWLLAEMDGEPIGTVAARCDESAWPLQTFVKNYWERTFPGEGNHQFVRIADGSPQPAAEYEAGRFVYLGEAVTKESLRSRNLSIILVRLALIFGFDEWRPSIAYGWMRDWHAYHGLHVRWGFNRCDNNAFEWQIPPAEEDYRDLAFLACTYSGFQTLLRHPAPVEVFRVRKSSSKGTANRQCPEPEE